MKCAKLYPTPFLRIECPHGYRTGSFCNISCDPGKSLTGNDFVTCDRSAAGMFGEWNWKNGKQATCKSNCPPFRSVCREIYSFVFFAVTLNGVLQSRRSSSV